MHDTLPLPRPATGCVSASGTRRAAPYPLAVRTDTELFVASASPCRPSLGYVSYEQTMTERACVVLDGRLPSSPRRVEG